MNIGCTVHVLFRKVRIGLILEADSFFIDLHHLLCYCLELGAEQEWKVAQSSMEAAASGLFSATNELCIASVKAKSASGLTFIF